MVVIALVALFISQLLCFFFIVMLHLKVSNLKDLEGKQQKMMQEMEQTIDAYLMEIQEENNRLIQELAYAEQESSMQSFASDQLTSTTDDQDAVVKPVVPVAMAANVYKKQKEQVFEEYEVKSAVENQPEEVKKTMTFEQQVLDLYEQGYSVEEIAKRTQKGKTEIELLIKFHNQ